MSKPSETMYRKETARSTSGGAICLGEHVVKTFCRQQKVIALSSAEAELYAMVAASAETLAIAAYAKDLGLDLKCELYCDSAAALGITQRAGIGKVRHLRTQGLWVQEVRISGRIVYRKVLGEKNPADLLTKHMSAELAGKHIETLNMQWAGGRAESAPTIDAISMVQGWYVNEDDTEATVVERRPAASGPGVSGPRLQFEKEIGNAQLGRRVHFSGVVGVRPIAASGRGRRTPPRGKSGIEGKWRREASGGDSLARGEVNSVQNDGEKAIGRNAGYECGHPPLPSLSDGARAWADLDEDDACDCCQRGWQTAIRGRRAGASRTIFNDRKRELQHPASPQGLGDARREHE